MDAGDGTGEASFQWHRDGVSVRAPRVATRDLVTAVGRPATELLDHPFLSRNIAVLEAAYSHDDEGERWLSVKLDMPRRLFCSVTGRVWDVEADLPDGHVVPFARRWA